MLYRSTRGGVRDVDFSTIVFSGYAPDGGLYVPQTIPIIGHETLLSWNSLNYSRLTSKILSLFVNNKVKPYLDEICDKAFSNFESLSETIPIKKVGNIYILETFRGPTLAFKDIGLNILALMMELLLTLENKEKNENKRANVLVQTSGDTGPAAVASVILNTSSINIFCMFPYKQVSSIQEKQLTTLMYKNDVNKRIVNVYSTDRSSDDQVLVLKNLFNDKSFISKYKIAAMNSINFVRIASQICYYFYSYLQIIPQCNKEINFSIPSGAFGNACAATFAKAMGLPIKNIIPCCNENDIVFRTLMFGDFSCSLKNYHRTKSPAMDEQIAYNIERFFWLSLNMNCELIKNIMNEFERNSKNMEFKYTFDNILKHQFKKFINIPYRVSDEQIKNITRHFVNNYNYLPCPHSACSLFGALNFINDKRIKNNDDVPMVAIATAHPAKFPNIIKEFFKANKMNDALFRNELYHPFLPKVGDKEKCIKWISDQGRNSKDNCTYRWTQQLKNDIIKANSKQNQSYQSKL